MDNANGGFAHASDGLPYTTLNYANGPGFSLTSGHRTDISHVDTSKLTLVIIIDLLPKTYTTYENCEMLHGTSSC